MTDYQLMDAREVAAMLGVKPEWVYEKTRQGEIPHVPLGRYRRYRPEAIIAWIEGNERAA